MQSPEQANYILTTSSVSSGRPPNGSLAEKDFGQEVKTHVQVNIHFTNQSSGIVSTMSGESNYDVSRVFHFNPASVKDATGQAMKKVSNCK